jgi:amino acid adenylation domain-containing protein
MDEVQEYQDIPFEKLVDMFDVPKDTSRHPIFQIMFAVQSFGSNSDNGLFEFCDIHNQYKIAKFDLSLFIDDSYSKLKCSFNYGKSLFSENTIKQLSKHFCNILESITFKADLPINDIQILSTEEYSRMLYEWNNTEVLYPQNQTIHQLFECQAEQTPNNIAVVFKKQQLIYRELNEKANQLARAIREKYKEYSSKELSRDTLIGIYIDRSLEMIIGILGILKSGAAYVPFSMTEPEERLKFKINDCSCKMLLTSSFRKKYLVSLVDSDVLTLPIDTCWEEIEKSPKTNPKSINKPDDLVYVIYTSGSTGKPKGVMVEHRNVTNVIYWARDNYKAKHLQKMLASTSIGFDNFVFELFVPLAMGGRVVLVDSVLQLASQPNLDITFMNIVPSAAQQISALGKIPRTVRIINVSGEPMPSGLPEQLYALDHVEQVWNLYGSSEEAIFFSSFLIPRNKKNLGCIIGRPLPNKQHYILGKNKTLMPLGVAGELYIGGAGVTRGYLNDPKLTAEKFINNLYLHEKDWKEKNKKDKRTRLYKTGDLVRYLADGNIEFVGRNDDQIKIRGFRVELGEIESKLTEHPAIKQCVVLCKEREENKYLVAYYVIRGSGLEIRDSSKKKQPTISSSKPQVSSSEIRTHLSKRLPDYMVPTCFVELEEFPLNTSGKTDKKALPDPELKGDEDNYVAPRNDLEKELVAIWQEMLGIERVGINDDFFRLGGNSISSIKLVNRISEGTNLKARVANVYGLLNSMKMALMPTICRYFWSLTTQLILIYSNRVLKVFLGVMKYSELYF